MFDFGLDPDELEGLCLGQDGEGEGDGMGDGDAPPESGPWRSDPINPGQPGNDNGFPVPDTTPPELPGPPEGEVGPPGTPPPLPEETPDGQPIDPERPLPFPPEADPELEPAPDTEPVPDTAPPESEPEESDDGVDLTSLLLPLATLPGYLGYKAGEAAAPYIYGDKNLDGSPSTDTVDESEVDPNYEDTWGWKINQWLED